MRRTSFWAIVGAAALLGPACGSWVKIPDHHVTVLAVDQSAAVAVALAVVSDVLKRPVGSSTG